MMKHVAGTILIALLAGCAAQTAAINMDTTRETMVGNWKGRTTGIDFEMRITDIDDDGSIHGRACVMFYNNVMAALELERAQLTGEGSFQLQTSKRDIRFAVANREAKRATVTMTMIAQNPRPITAKLYHPVEDTKWICIDRFATETVTPIEGTQDAEHPIIGQWTEHEDHEGNIQEVEFTKVGDNNKTLFGRKCTRDYEHDGMRLMDLGLGRRQVQTSITDEGRGAISVIYLESGYKEKSVYTVNEDDTLTHNWAMEQYGTITEQRQYTKYRGARENGCLTHTTRRVD